MDTVPLDVLKHLAMYLDLFSLCRFFQVCRRFSSIDGDDKFWIQKFQHDYPKSELSTRSLRSAQSARNDYCIQYFQVSNENDYDKIRKRMMGDNPIYQEAKKTYEKIKADCVNELNLWERRLHKLLEKTDIPNYIRISTHDNISFGKTEVQWIQYFEELSMQKITGGTLVHFINNDIVMFFYFFQGGYYLKYDHSIYSFPFEFRWRIKNRGWSAADIQRIYKLPFEVTPDLYQW